MTRVIKPVSTKSWSLVCKALPTKNQSKLLLGSKTKVLIILHIVEETKTPVNVQNVEICSKLARLNRYI